MPTARRPDLLALTTLLATKRKDRDGDAADRPAPTVARPEQSRGGGGNQPDTAWSEAEDERAAIVEYDGGAPREWAEGFARLDPDRPPGDVPPRRWLQFVDDIGRFLDNGFAEQAAALGWGPFDLFGCDRDRPFAWIDGAGLLWQLNGDRLVALTVDAAVIETRAGARQTYPSEPDRVLAWELEAR